MAKDPAIAKPTSEVTSVNYDRECQDALAEHIDKLLDDAQSVGWNRNRAASALMYLSARRLKEP